MQPAVAPFQDLVDESLDEAAFLWQRWESELTSLTRNLDEVWSWTEDRLHGALDGVRVAGAGVVDVATKGLLSDERERIAASAGTLASSAERPAIDALAAALAVAEGDRLRAMTRGLELLGSNPGLRAAAAVLVTRGPEGAGALCRLKAFRRAGMGDEVMTAFASAIPAVQADAVRSILHTASPQFDELIDTALQSDDVVVRTAAVETGVGRGIARALEAATSAARRLDADAAPYLRLLALLGTAEDHEVVYDALRVPDLQRDAIWALGHLGTVRAVDACLAGMQHERLARACGEAYCWITGADLARDRLAAEETPPDAPAFEEDDLDANLVPPPEAFWPVPDPDAARRDWRARRPDFAAETRHIHGRPAAHDTLLALIETGPMLRRPDLVLELRARTRGQYDVETRAFARRQRQMMAAGRAAASSLRGN